MQRYAPIPFAPEYGATPEGEIARIVPNSKSPIGLRPLSVFVCSRGYHRVKMIVNGKPQKVAVHRALAWTFLGPPPPDKPFACHNDGDRSHNYLSNIRWDNGYGNMADKLAHNTHQRGEKCGMAKLSNAQVVDIRSRPRYQGLVNALAKEFDVCASTITSIRNGRRRIWG